MKKRKYMENCEKKRKRERERKKKEERERERKKRGGEKKRKAETMKKYNYKHNSSLFNHAFIEARVGEKEREKGW